MLVGGVIHIAGILPGFGITQPVSLRLIALKIIYYVAGVAVVAVPEIAKKELIGIHMPMIKNETSLKNAHVFHVLKDNSRTHNNLSIQPAYL